MLRPALLLAGLAWLSGCHDEPRRDPVLTAEALLSTVSPDAMAWMTISDERAVAAKANLSQLWRRALRQK